MAEVNNSQVIGDFEVRPTEYDSGEQLDILKKYDKALGNAGHDRLHYQPAGLFCIDLYCLTTVAAGTSEDTVRIKAPFPFTVWAADVGCEAAGGATATADLYVDDGTVDASILDAAESILAGAGTTTARVAPEDGSEDVAFGDELYAKFASGAGGTIVGGCARLWVQRK